MLCECPCHLLLLLPSPVTLVTVKESSIKTKSAKIAAKYFMFILSVLILKFFKRFENFLCLPRETSRVTHALVLMCAETKFQPVTRTELSPSRYSPSQEVIDEIHVNTIIVKYMKCFVNYLKTLNLIR